MPLYEYQCANCEGRFTLLQSMSAPREGNACPHCGAAETRRLISAFARTASDAGACGPAGSPFR